MKLVSVEYKKGGKNYLFFDNNLNLKAGDIVIVETEKGNQIATIVKTGIEPKENENRSLVLNLATSKDIKKSEENIKEAEKAILKAQSFANDLGLNMKFIDAYFSIDRKQLVFNFSADTRIDFRELAKNLASVYKTRIELRQVGARDEAKELSGLGACGRKICCSCFLKDLDFVGINMVKNQNLSLNPNKINGICGRLLCCLKYEDDMYTECRKGMPSIDDEVKTDDGEKATVISVDIPRRMYKVMTESGNKIEIKLKDSCDNCEKKKYCNK